jgi:hypothetical protein
MSRPRRHSLAGVRAKIERAKKDFRDLNAEVGKFMRNDPYGLVPYCDLDTREEVWVLRVSEEVPDSFAAAVGVVVHSLRSAFDILAGQVKTTGNNPPITKHEFPIFWERDTYEAEGRRKVQGASDIAMRLIERLQPWQRGDRFAEDPLYIIHELDRLDKHNDIILVGGGTAFNLSIGSKTGSFYAEHLVIGGNRLVCPLEDGAEVYRARFGSPEVDVNAQFVFFVAFDQSGVGKGKPIIPTLLQLIQFAEGAINSFAPLFR